MDDSIDRIYGALNGDAPIRELVGAFYAQVEQDPILKPMYPDDLAGARERLTLFLIQRLGGPSTYSDQRGHPRLRMRHAPFLITSVERDAWVRNMKAALDKVPDLQPHRSTIETYFADTADFLVNRVHDDSS